MQISNIPVRYQKVWGVNAAGAYIRTVPVNSQIGIQDGAASFNDGFVPDNFAPVAAGGVPPFGQDFNGILNVDTAWMQWMQAGGPIPYDSTFASAIGGYPKGAVLSSAVVLGAQWYSTVDDNTTDPDNPLTSSGWIRVGQPAGAPQPFLSTVPTGFVLASAAVTIGSAASSATYAAADALFLYAANWSNSSLPIYTSGGVLTTRGANAVADFAANKRLQMPDLRGASIIGVDSGGSTYLSGVPVTTGNTTTPGSTFGENLHALTSGENGAHTHVNTLSDPGHRHTFPYSVNNIAQTDVTGGNAGNTNAQNTSLTTTGITINNASSGSGTAHNTVQRSLGVNWGQKL